MNACVPATLCRLRQVVAKIEGQETDLVPDARTLSLGVRSINAVLRGGLAPASLHEMAPVAPRDLGAAAGFILALAARAGRQTLWIQTDFAAQEAGNIYGLGCDAFGLPSRQLLVLKVARPVDALWAMEEALKCRALSSVVAELPDDGAIADLNGTRRLTLAARAGGGFGFLLRHHGSEFASAAETRWHVAAAPGHPNPFGGLSRAAFALSLVKNRHGPPGHWTVAWNAHDCVFSSLSLGVAQTAFDRPDRTPFARAG